MTENIMGIMVLLVGVMATCIVWLFIDVHNHEDTIRYLETEQRNNERQDHELWKSVDRCEERIAKMDAIIHETLTPVGPEVRSDE